MKIISPLFKGTVNTWLGKKILRSKPGIPISNNFYFKYSVNIYVDMQQNFWFCKPKSSFKRRKEEKKKSKSSTLSKPKNLEWRQNKDLYVALLPLVKHH